MSILKNGGAAALGWLVMAVVVFVGHALAWLGMGAEGSFQPDSWTPSTLWPILSIAINAVAAVLGGVVCAKVAPDRWGVWALAGIVLVLGVLTALLDAPAAAGPRPAGVSMMEAMTNAQPPRWLTWLNPLVGAAGALAGAALVDRQRPG